MKIAHVDVTVRLIVRLGESVNITQTLDDMDYKFTIPSGINAIILSEEIVRYDIRDYE
jgi:hypothetical protein